MRNRNRPCALFVTLAALAMLVLHSDPSTRTLAGPATAPSQSAATTQGWPLTQPSPVAIAEAQTRIRAVFKDAYASATRPGAFIAAS